MRKQFLLIFIIIINVSIYSQVVIKDEIILYETENPDEENLTMPFYGKVQGTVPWGSVYWNHFKRVEIEAGGQLVSRGCPCNGCGYFNGNWVINNLPAATPVIVRAYTHCVNGNFVEGETRLINTGINEWSIEVFSYNFQIWTQATTLKFISQTAINCTEPCEDCPELPECEYYDDYPTFTFERQAEGFNNTVACTSSVCPSDPEQENQLAGYTPVSRWDLLDGYTWNLYLCSDPTNGNVNFRYAVDYNGQTINSIPIPYIIAHCNDSGCDPSKIHIEDIDDFVEKLKTHSHPEPIIHPNEYCELLDDICSHWGSFPQPNYRFLLTELTEFHEEQHLIDYKNVINLYKEQELYPFINTIKELCSNYQSNQQGVIDEAIETFRKRIESFIQKAYTYYFGLPSRDAEIQNLTDMAKKAYEYYTTFRKLRNLGVQLGGIPPGPNCAPISSCNNLIDFINNLEE